MLTINIPSKGESVHMINAIDSVINAISGVLYQPWCVPLFLLVAGVYFTLRFRLIQIRLFKEACSVIMEKPNQEGNISSFGALIFRAISQINAGRGCGRRNSG